MKQMLDILTLPQDVHSAIWLNLNLRDLLRLRKTCSRLSEAISSDKQLWIQVINREVKAKSLCTPTGLRRLEDVNAQDIESWVRHAYELKRNYKNANRKINVRSIEAYGDLAVTWMSLVLGQWCLVAYADTEKSELTMWEIPREGEIRLVSRSYLDAPVIDGLVDDSDGCVRFAVTVGASIPYILILSISRHGEDVVFHQLSQIAGASSIRFFCSHLVGFSVKDGDDTYPYLVDWKQSELHKLYIPSNASSPSFSPLPLDPCIAMTVKDGFILTLHRSLIHVFLSPQLELRSNALHIATMHLNNKACEGQFIDTAASDEIVDINGSRMFLRVCFQDCYSMLRQVAILREECHGQIPRFRFEEVENANPPEVYGNSVLSRYCLGTSCRTIFCITSPRVCPWSSSDVFVSSVRLPMRAEDQLFAIFDGYVPVSKDDLPLTNLITSLAFDDGNGLLLVGTLSGDLHLLSFMEKEIVASRSYVSLLEVVPESNTTLDSGRISQIARNQDLSLFYRLRKAVEPLNIIPPAFVQEIIRSWDDPNASMQELSEWSNDWSLFERMWDWVAPAFRWGHLDPDLSNYSPPSVTARNRLSALGDIIPVLYDKTKHGRVVFRIGHRMFYCRSRSQYEDDEERDDFEDEYEIILGVLPCTYADFLTSPASILPHLSDFDTQRNLGGSWIEPKSVRSRSEAAYVAVSIRRWQISQFKTITDYASMKHWSEDEWDLTFRSLRKEAKTAPE